MSGGAFTCDFGMPDDLPLEQVGPLVERDRVYMAARPGLLHKHIPLSIDPATGKLQSGGRYLFRTEKQAEAYKRWVERDFILDGTPFLQRRFFLAPDWHTWSVVGAKDLGEIRARHVVLRTERWSVQEGNHRHVLKARWPAILAEAQRRDLTSVWLLYNERERLASLVYFAGRAGPRDPLVPDFASLVALETAPPLGRVFDGQNWARTFDRTQWVLTIWFPFIRGDRGEAPVWPNSPPLPAPHAGDTVREVSRQG